MRSLRSTLVISLVLSVLGLTLKPSQAKADGTRDFVMSCTYGVLAGTLVGAATLSFVDHPGDKLYRVARGASLGLYAGILLGWYVTSLDSDGGAPPPEDETLHKFHEPNLQVYPLVSQRGVEGGAFKYSVLNF